MQITNVQPLLIGIEFVHLLGLIVLFIELVYVFFAFLLIRQIKLMNKSFKTPMGPLFMFLGRVHFVAAIIVAGVSFLVLF